MTLRPTLPLLLLALLFPASAFAELDVSAARIKNLPPTVPVRAGYMTLQNPGLQAVTTIEKSFREFVLATGHGFLYVFFSFAECFQ